MPVTTSDTVQGRLKYLHDTCALSWSKIAALDEFSPIPRGTLCSIAKTGNVPHCWKRHFGIPAQSNVVVVEGVVPAGSQAISAQQCPCGQYFISNHPRRKRCFVCSPYRRRLRANTL